MLTDWIIKEHPAFFKDLDKLGGKELQNFYDKLKKIKATFFKTKIRFIAGLNMIV